MRAVDLHTHSNMSDGSLSPVELMQYAHDKGLAAIALTDHDTVKGVPQALEFVSENFEDMEVIPGVELSTNYQGKEVHVVGLMIDYTDKAFNEKLDAFVYSRDTRNARMCERLTEYGFPIKLSELEEEFPKAILTRAHFAKHMLEKGMVSSMKEAFDRYLGNGCPCYIERVKPTPNEAVELILGVGGIPVLAHPVLYNMSDAKLRELVESMKEAGLIGIEALYSSYAPADERYIKRLAREYGLQISGGSDFHGTNKPGLDLGNGYGHLFIPEEVLDKLKESRP